MKIRHLLAACAAPYRASIAILVALLFGSVAALVFSSPAFAVAAPTDRREQLAQSLAAKAQAKNLADESGWRELLMMRDRMFGKASSIVDTAAFFFSDPDVDWTPAGELNATILAFAREGKEFEAKPDEQPVCRFPARYRWISAHLPEFAAKVPRPASCPGYDRWHKSLGAEKVGLVFSSYFANNPSSMFGHSFLRMHRAPEPGRVASPMLDDTINFMAYPNTDNPALYILSGGFGGFPGLFSGAAMYVKLQEYNNAESRDLWEYSLSFDRAEILYMHEILWDLGPQTINYYYFDENCALIWLLLFNAVRPSLHLHEMHDWVIPSDVLRVVDRAPGLVNGHEYFPSAMTRFLARFEALSQDEKDVALAIIKANDVSDAALELKLLPSGEAAAVIDSVVEFVDYDEKLAGSKEAIVHGPLRKFLLAQRAELRVPRREVAIAQPVEERPDRGGGTTRLGGGLGRRRNGQSFFEFGWRPALHDLAEPDLGYSRGLAITFFDSALRYDQALKKLYVQHFDPLTILSAPTMPRIMGPFSWNLGLEAENRGLCTDPWLSCYESRVRAGLGPVTTLGPLTGYALVRGEAGTVAEAGYQVFAGAALAGGVLLPLSAFSKISLYAEKWRRYGQGFRAADDYKVRGDAAFSLRERFEVRLAVEKRRLDAEAQLAFYRFY